MCSLGCTVLNSIIVLFLFIYFLLNRRQSTTQDRQRKENNKGKIILCRLSRLFSLGFKSRPALALRRQLKSISPSYWEPDSFVTRGGIPSYTKSDVYSLAPPSLNFKYPCSSPNELFLGIRQAESKPLFTSIV